MISQRREGTGDAIYKLMTNLQHFIFTVFFATPYMYLTEVFFFQRLAERNMRS